MGRLGRRLALMLFLIGGITFVFALIRYREWLLHRPLDWWVAIFTIFGSVAAWVDATRGPHGDRALPQEAAAAHCRRNRDREKELARGAERRLERRSIRGLRRRADARAIYRMAARRRPISSGRLRERRRGLRARTAIPPGRTRYRDRARAFSWPNCSASSSRRRPSRTIRPGFSSGASGSLAGYVRLPVAGRRLPGLRARRRRRGGQRSLQGGVPAARSRRSGGRRAAAAHGGR